MKKRKWMAVQRWRLPDFGRWLVCTWQKREEEAGTSIIANSLPIITSILIRILLFATDFVDDSAIGGGPPSLFGGGSERGRASYVPDY
jgi:hypothetical protein